MVSVSATNGNTLDDTPFIPLVPDEPEVPDEPLVPEEPEVPDVPEEPDVPLEPEVPELPDVPEEPDVPLEPEDPLVPEEPEVPELPDVPASVLRSTLPVVSFQTNTWSDVLPLGTAKTFKPLRATNSLFPAMIFFFHCPKEKFFYVYYLINIKMIVIITFFSKKNHTLFRCGFIIFFLFFRMSLLQIF